MPYQLWKSFSGVLKEDLFYFFSKIIFQKIYCILQFSLCQVFIFTRKLPFNCNAKGPVLTIFWKSTVSKIDKCSKIVGRLLIYNLCMEKIDAAAIPWILFGAMVKFGAQDSSLWGIFQRYGKKYNLALWIWHSDLNSCHLASFKFNFDIANQHYSVFCHFRVT